MEPYTIKLTGVARIQIMAIMDSDKQRGKRLDPEFQTVLSLYEKIYISNEQQDNELSFRGEDGIKRLHPDKVNSMPPHTVRMNHKELTKLENILSEFEARPMDHKIWYDNVMAQILEAGKPEIEDEMTRTTRLELRKSAIGGAHESARLPSSRIK